jgi:DNA-binding NtrC family response regulator
VFYHGDTGIRRRTGENRLKPLLLVEDDSALRSTLTTFLDLEGFAVEAVGTTDEALARLNERSYPFVVSDIYLDRRTGLDVLQAARESNPACSVVLMTGRGSMETVMQAAQSGAFDYIAKPFELDSLLDILRRAETAMADSDGGDEDSEIEDLPETEIIGSSRPMVELYKLVSRVAPTDATVLIEGETGTGKEMVARMIHNNSGDRAQFAYVPVDCASIAPSLLESELFGAMKGAYTGADRDRTGVFESANRGTVFLDEIGEIEMGFQLRLLRFLQERTVKPLGSSRSHQVDVRVLCATNKDIAQLVDDEKFREDLWFRINTVRVTLPPLRERHGDIPLLAHHFLRKYNTRYQLEAKLTESGVKTMEAYTWPGNVRQLQHIMERLTILAAGARIDDAAVKSAIEATEPRDAAGETLADTEAEQIRRVLGATNGNKSRAARILGIERKTLYRKLEKMGLA